MNTFSDKYSYTVDPKGRINFKKILKRLSSEERENSNYHLLKQTVKAPGSDRKYPFFYIFTENSWKKFYEKRVEGLKTPVRIGFLKKYCREASLDSSERLSFPKDFLSEINAEKNIVLQGDGDKIQVWASDIYEDYINNIGNLSSGDEFEDMFSQVRS